MRAPRYRFADFIVSPAQRLLTRSGEEVALVPRYFDLLVFLVQRRERAVHRREVLDAVWADVVVSDGALNQAVRTLRRALGDDSKEPRFLRTVSRHGYQFVFAPVVEEADEGPLKASSASVNPKKGVDELFEAALVALTGGADDETRRQAALTLHELGVEEALRRLDARPGHLVARALLRDTRWDSPAAGRVPLLGAPGGLASGALLFWMRLRLAARAAGERWLSAAGGGALAGALGGVLGGLLLRVCEGDRASPQLIFVFATAGAIIGGVGASGVGAGLAAAEAVARSFRGMALVGLGALGGGAVGALANLAGRWTLAGLFGKDLTALGGGSEGVSIGAAAGLAYALATRRTPDGMATPRGWARFKVTLACGLSCAAAGVALTKAGGRLGGVSLDAVARSFEASKAGLEPLGRLLGEADLGPRTRALLATYEGGLFGLGLALGLTRRPR